jgi:hypothetical protein
MKQTPLFKRQFFVQRPDSSTTDESAGAVEYVRIHGNPSNPGEVLNGQKLKVSKGGMVDIVAESRGGEGLGRIAYAEGLRAGIKRGDEVFTYRFEVPSTATDGEQFSVSVWGTDLQPSFRFTIEVGVKTTKASP